MNDAADLREPDESLKTVGNISYLLTPSWLWLLLLAPGWIAWGLVSIWFLYRVVRGWMNLSRNQAMPQP